MGTAAIAVRSIVQTTLQPAGISRGSETAKGHQAQGYALGRWTSRCKPPGCASLDDPLQVRDQSAAKQ